MLFLTYRPQSDLLKHWKRSDIYLWLVLNVLHSKYSPDDISVFSQLFLAVILFSIFFHAIPSHKIDICYRVDTIFGENTQCEISNNDFYKNLLNKLKTSCWFLCIAEKLNHSIESKRDELKKRNRWNMQTICGLVNKVSLRIPLCARMYKWMK